MGELALSRDAVRGLFAVYALKAHHDHKPQDEHRPLRVFGPAEDIPDHLLLERPDRVELPGSKPLVAGWSDRLPKQDRQRPIRQGSDFLHTLMRYVGQTVQ